MSDTENICAAVVFCVAIVAWAVVKIVDFRCASRIIKAGSKVELTVNRDDEATPRPVAGRGASAPTDRHPAAPPPAPPRPGA